MSKNHAVSAMLAATLCAGALFQARAVTWTGASPEGSQLWSEPVNWDTLLAPTSADVVNFADLGSTNVPRVVNNVVSADTTITNLTYKSKVSFISMATNYHTTLLSPGVTLTINRGTYGSSLISVGEVTDPLNQDLQYHYAIQGPGASLVAGNLADPVSSQGLQVTATQRSFTNHMGTLDLSGLDNFSLAGGYFWVGINGGEATIATDRPAGRVLLAKTNYIAMVGDTYDLLNFGSFRIGESRANTPSQPSFLELGQENTICTPWLKVGGARTGTTTGGFMYFRAGLDKPTLKLRGSDGVSRLGTMRIGDNSWTSTGSIGSRGVVDLTGGRVDAYINELFVGRGPGGNSATAPLAGAFATGSLTWTDGTFDVSTFLIGYQYGNNVTTNSGTVNVRTPNAKLIADRLVVGRDAGAFAGGGVGLLNIDGGTVEITTYLAESVSDGNNVSSTIIITNNGVLNLQPAGDTSPAAATIDTLDYSSGTVTNGILALTNINVLAPASAFTAYTGTSLNPGTADTVGTLNINGSLALSGGTLTFDVADSANLDQIIVGGNLSFAQLSSVEINPLSPISAGTYSLVTYASLTGSSSQLKIAGPVGDSRYGVSFDTAAPNVSVTLSGGVSYLSWSGGQNGNAWDLKQSANWNSGAEKFYALDVVEFGDAGSAAPAINLVGTLFPGGVTLNASSKDYTFVGSGRISGLFGVTLNGTSTLTVLTTNDYKGATTINAGTLVLGNGSADGTTGSGGIVNYATLVVNPGSTQTVANVISGAGTVIKRGSGLLRLAGANTFTGPVTVEGGILQAGSTTTLGDPLNGMATIQSGATLDIGGNALGAKPVTVSGAGVNGAGAIINSGAAQANALRDVQLGGATTFGGTGSWSISSASATSTDPGLTAYGYKITKVGTNQVTINCLRSAAWDLGLGEVDVQEGALTLQGNINLGSAVAQPITVRSNAALALVNYGGVTLTKAFSLADGSCMHGRGTNSAVDGSITIAGGVVFDTLSGAKLVVNCPITGSGTLVKGVGYHPSAGTSTGGGILLLNAANTFSGDLLIQAGQVALTNDASIVSPNIILSGGSLSATSRTDGTLTLASGQSLKGNGTILGVVSSPASSIVAPAATNGILAVTGNLTLRGSTVMDLNRTGSTTNSSRITVTGTLDCGGSLTLTSSGEAFHANDTFKLFAASTTLNPFETSAITWPSLAGGLYWTNRIAVDGTIAVASVEPVDRPTLAVSVAGDGGSLSASWPAAYTTYMLQAQTNSTSVGLSDNWATVTTVGNQITLQINPANGSVFLRLIKQ